MKYPMLPLTPMLPEVIPLLLAPEPPRVSSQFPAWKSALASAAGISARAPTTYNALRNMRTSFAYEGVFAIQSARAHDARNNRARVGRRTVRTAGAVRCHTPAVAYLIGRGGLAGTVKMCPGTSAETAESESKLMRRRRRPRRRV